jgi:hypothetical protein
MDRYVNIRLYTDYPPMRGIRLGGREHRMDVEAHLPVPLAMRPIGDEVLVSESLRVVLGPDAAGAAEVGNTGLGGDPGAGEDHEVLGAGEDCSGITT